MNTLGTIGRNAAAAAMALSAMLSGSGPLSAQASLPATAPTAVTPSQLPSANPPVFHGGTSIQWDGRLLQITADGESLNRVLAEIATRSGMHLAGNPPGDPIYGTYGPAPLIDVVSELVSGLPVNILFVERAGSRPAELTFTARNGAATPPGAAPQQPSFAQQQPRQYPAAAQPQYQPQPSYQPQQPPPPPAAATSAGPGLNGGASPSDTTAPDATSANPSSPNGVKTPQEIFEQLQRLRANSGAQH